jgi:hypothetical protein
MTSLNGHVLTLIFTPSTPDFDFGATFSTYIFREIPGKDQGMNMTQNGELETDSL